MSQIRIKEAAGYLGVSDDTLRRWIDNGALAASTDDAGRMVVDGSDLARLARDTALARENASSPADPSTTVSSARNRFVGLVTRVVSDPVMSQVELQCGPHRVVSLMSTEAVQDLGLVPGSVAVAVVKATTVIVETPKGLS